jgi:hypothetical protein
MALLCGSPSREVAIREWFRAKPTYVVGRQLVERKPAKGTLDGRSVISTGHLERRRQ